MNITKKKKKKGFQITVGKVLKFPLIFLRMLASAKRNFAQKYALGIEIGGQTAAFAITDKLGSFLYKKKGIPTRVPITPEEAKDNIVRAIRKAGFEIDRIGIATFGPVDLYRGRIAKTPKPAWVVIQSSLRYKLNSPKPELLLILMSMRQLIQNISL